PRAARPSRRPRSRLERGRARNAGPTGGRRRRARARSRAPAQALSPSQGRAARARPRRRPPRRRRSAVSDPRDESDSVLRRIAAAPARAPSTRSLAAKWKPGTILLDRYRIVDERGRGGMGRVFAARDQRLERDVAIKILLAEASDDKV